MFVVTRASNFSYGQVPLEISRPLAAGPRLSSVEVPPLPRRGGSLTRQALRHGSASLTTGNSGQALQRCSGQALRPIRHGSASLTTGNSGQALQRCSGQATLSFILLVSGVVLEVAVAGSFVAYFMNSAGFGERLSARALAAAQTGIDDTILQIVRNKEFAAVESASYNFTVGSDSVYVAATRTTDSAAGVYVFAVTSTGTAGTRQRRLVARVVADQITGLTKLQDVVERAVD